MRAYAQMSCLCMVLVVAAVPQPAHAITVCFDYVMYLLNNDGNDVNKQWAPGVRDDCNKHGMLKALTIQATVTDKYANLQPNGDTDRKLTVGDLNIVVTPESGVTDKELRKGDVLLFGDAHAGMVCDDQGHITHYLQDPHNTGVRHAFSDLPKEPNFFPPDKAFTLLQMLMIERSQPGGPGIVFQHPCLTTTVEVWRKEPAIETKTVAVKPGAWVPTGIHVRGNEGLFITGGGECIDENGKPFGAEGAEVPSGPNRLHFVTAGFMRTDGKVITFVPVGNFAQIHAQAGELVLGIAHEGFGSVPAPSDASSLKGSFQVTVRAPYPPERFVPRPIASSAAPIALTIHCPVMVELKDAQGRRNRMGTDGKIVTEIPDSTLTATPDSARGYVWFAELPKGTYTATCTGTANGTFEIIARLGNQPVVAYPPIDTVKGSVATLQISDEGKPQALSTGEMGQYSPTALPGLSAQLATPVASGSGSDSGGAAGGNGQGAGASPGAGANSGGASSSAGVPSELSAGQNLRIARWTTYRHITHFARGDESHSIGAAKISANGAVIYFASQRGTFVINPDGANLRQISSKYTTIIDVSADGKKIAWFEGGYDALFVANSDGSGKQKMPPGFQVLSIRLTADGSRLYILCPEKGGVFVMPTDGSDVKRVITTAAVCKMLGIDENPNLWQNIDISDDGSRIVANMTVYSVAFSADGSNPHQLSDTKGVQIDGTRISADGRRVVHLRRTRETSSFLVRDFDGGNAVTFPRPWEETLPVQMSPDGSRFVTNWGVKLYDVASKAVYDPLDLGTAMTLSRPHQLSLTADQKRGCVTVDDAESSQLMIVDFNPTSLAGAPALAEIAISPRFILNDGSSGVRATARVTDRELRQVGAAPIRSGEHLNDLNTWWSLNDSGSAGDETSGDGIFTSTVNIHTASGKPLEAGAVTLRLHAMNKAGDLTVIDLEGLEVRQP